MTIYETFSQMAADWRTARAHAKTERILGGLPQEVLKDIGWPERTERRFPPTLGSWGGAR